MYSYHSPWTVFQIHFLFLWCATILLFIMFMVIRSLLSSFLRKLIGHGCGLCAKRTLFLDFRATGKKSGNLLNLEALGLFSIRFLFRLTLQCKNRSIKLKTWRILHGRLEIRSFSSRVQKIFHSFSALTREIFFNT